MLWVSGLMWLITVMEAAAFAQVTSNASAVEQALIEHACRSQVPGLAGADAYRECLATHLGSLRAYHGRDLSQLSVADRNMLDTTCGAKRAAEGREAYLECLTVQLAALHNRDNPTAPPPPDAVAPQSENSQPAAVVRPRAVSWLSPLWISVGVITLIAATGGAVFATKHRRGGRRAQEASVSQNCRVCGADVPQGDMCPKCRREAADALRQAAAARLQSGRPVPAEQTDEDRQRAIEDEAANLRQQEEAAQQEKEARRDKEVEESRQRSRAVDEVSEVFDPCAILGVPRDASRETIDAACEMARLKYAPDHVAHLGPELQEYYRQKAEAVERAYQILTG
jgi:hypothetical protein